MILHERVLRASSRSGTHVTSTCITLQRSLVTWPRLTTRETGKQSLAVNLCHKISMGCLTHSDVSGPFAVGSLQVGCEPGWGEALG